MTSFSDQRLWEFGISYAVTILEGLDHSSRLSLKGQLYVYSQHKAAMLLLTDQVDAASICMKCRGACCENGKYRISVLDVLAHIDLGVTPVSPDFFQKPLCPYSDSEGCRIEAAMRPADCVMFICDAIESALDENIRSELMTHEQELRKIITEAGQLLGLPAEYSLLMYSERIMNQTLKRQETLWRQQAM